MRTLVVSSSLSRQSRSGYLAKEADDWLRHRNVETSFIQLQANHLPGFDADDLFESSVYLDLYHKAQNADNVILASPIYNWNICSELKKFIEVIGSTDASRPSPFFDKLVSFIFAAGLPHSYMAMSSISTSLMLDFRCIINPHQAYLHNRDWDGETTLTTDGRTKLEKMLHAHQELGERLRGYGNTSAWTV